MEYDLDSAMGFDKLGLYFETHVAGLDGENFFYNVYFEDAVTHEKYVETCEAIRELLSPYYDDDIFLGEIDVSEEDDKISIYLDLGNADTDYENTAINGILEALDNVSGIKSVIINEGCDSDF